MNKLDNAMLLDIIARAYAEDLGQRPCDITSDTLLADCDIQSQAQIRSKHETAITLSGMAMLPALIAPFDGKLSIVESMTDGEIAQPGQPVCQLAGDAKCLLIAERTILNFLRHLSGIASVTQQFVALVAPYGTKILDTRKTTPGLRKLEKYAVQCGGGVNHRMGLYDAVIIKDTHIDILGGLHAALDKITRNVSDEYPVIIEISELSQLDILLPAADRVTRVLFDNMPVDEMTAAVQRCQGLVETEASGNITLETIVAIANTGVDYASVGMLTHSAAQVDLSMKIHW